MEASVLFIDFFHDLKPSFEVVLFLLQLHDAFFIFLDFVLVLFLKFLLLFLSLCLVLLR